MATFRQNEIVQNFLDELDKHMSTIAAGKLNDKFTVQDFAAILYVHPVHLTNVVKIVTGRTPCSFYKEKLTATAKLLLADPLLTISEIAYLLTFDTSNFSKFFKRNTGMTPKTFRQNLNTPATP